MVGTLILCAGPIGNLSDAPPRLAEALASAAVVYAEDTRRARVLLSHLGVDRPLRSYFVGNEEERSAEIRSRLEAGDTVALLTDAGSPAVADPGVSAVRVAIAVGAVVTAIPGPSAVTMAVGLSGLSGDRFVFEGFLPRKGRERSERLAAIAADTRTTVLFCAPGRLAGDLADLATMAPDRDVVVCREMTKMFEEVWRGSVLEAADVWAARTVKGEVTIVVGGGTAAIPDLEAAAAQTRHAIEAGERPSEAVKRIAASSGVSRRALYEAVIGS
jgi:16S rRNA (cytidine1402-2'-O)-methyltransferase